MAKTLVCKDCQQEFEFSDGEEANLRRLVEEGRIDAYNEPKRCRDCRAAKKGRQPGGGGAKETTATVCAQCGLEARVPFKPRGDRPVYCSKCFETHRK